MSPFWIKTLVQLVASIAKRWWNRKTDDKDDEKNDQKIIDDINKERKV